MARFKYSLLMLLAAFIWGTAFVAQREGAGVLDAYSFNSIRSFIGSAALLAVVATIGRKGAALQLSTRRRRLDLLVGGVVCGLVLTASALFQQLGLEGTTAGKAGFITSLYILFVPLAGMALGRRVRAVIWVGVVLALAGMYLLCVKEGFSVGKGDLMVLRCAVTFSIHILVIDHFVKKIDAVFLSQMQFFFCGIFSLVPILLWHAAPLPSATAVRACLWPLLYCAILSSGVAYTLQIVSQKHLEASVASLIMSMESVFAALSGWAVLGERLTLREIAGCALVFAAVTVAQRNGKDNRKVESSEL